MSGQNKFNPYVQGKRIYLREVSLSDVNDTYYRWMNDPEINRYIESRFLPNDMDSLRDDVQKKLEDQNSVFLAIICKDTERHIGNIKLGPIDWNHRLADVGVLIGERGYQGRGYATEAIALVVELAFQDLNLHKLTAGYYAANKGSEKAFKRNGFIVEGVRTRHRFCEGSYMDTVILGLLNEEKGAKR
jgi:ribosomal-protein-alanine N-acetyltransferase